MSGMKTDVNPSDIGTKALERERAGIVPGQALSLLMF